MLFLNKESRMLKKQARKATKTLLKEARRVRRSRHRMALGVLLHADRTLSSREIDLNLGERTIFFDGIAYNVPLVQYRLRKWWPYKARTFKRKLFPDQHYIIVWIEGEPNSIDCTSALNMATHKNILPYSLGGLIKESLFSRAVMSMKSKNKMGVSNKVLAIIIVVVIAIVIVILISKLTGMW